MAPPKSCSKCTLMKLQTANQIDAARRLLSSKKDFDVESTTLNEILDKFEKIIDRQPPAPPLSPKNGGPDTGRNTDRDTKNIDAIQLDSNWKKVVNSFDKMNLKASLLRGIYGHGIEKPSAVQELAIFPCVTNGRDAIIQGQSGMGKTATFSIITLSKIDPKDPNLQALILVPTRELAEQAKKEMDALASHMNVSTCVCVGGTSVKQDVEKMEDKKNGCQILIGTTGRISDLMRRKAISTEKLRIAVLDEADEMLSVTQGFLEEVKDLYQLMAPQQKKTQKLFVSATFPDDVLKEAKKMVRNPITILVRRDELTLEGIRQFYVNIEREEWKFETFFDVFQNLDFEKNLPSHHMNHLPVASTIIFCNKRKTVEWLTNRLLQKGRTVTAMHGLLAQTRRDEIMNDFRTGAIRVLITTDLCGRGVDVQQVFLVINYDMPVTKEKKPNPVETYIHRVGRGGRFGRQGLAISFVSEDELVDVKIVEEYYATEVREMPHNVDEIF